MAKNRRWRTGKNALANVCRGGATAVVALALPHFLTRTLGGERFAAWSLMLQMSAIAAYFDFGLQTILGRFVAQAAEREEDGTLSKLASTSMVLLAVASLFPLAACVLFLPLLPLVFHSSSIVILHEIQKGVAILVIGTALSLPLSACTGLLVGLHKNEIPALAIGASRLLGALTVIVCARYTGSLMILALCFTSWNLIGGLAQLLWVKRLLPSLKLTAQFYDGNLAKMLVHQSLVLTVLSFCMILIKQCRLDDRWALQFYCGWPILRRDHVDNILIWPKCDCLRCVLRSYRGDGTTGRSGRHPNEPGKVDILHKPYQYGGHRG